MISLASQDFLKATDTCMRVESDRDADAGRDNNRESAAYEIGEDMTGDHCSPGDGQGAQPVDHAGEQVRRHAGRGGHRSRPLAVGATPGAEFVLIQQPPTGHLPAGTAGISASFTIFEGTSEIQRMIIGRAVTGLDVR